MYSQPGALKLIGLRRRVAWLMAREYVGRQIPACESCGYLVSVCILKTHLHSHVHTCICIHVYIHIHIYISVCIDKTCYAHTHLHCRTYIMHKLTNTCVYMYIHMYVYAYVFIKQTQVGVRLHAIMIAEENRTKPSCYPALTLQAHLLSVEASHVIISRPC